MSTDELNTDENRWNRIYQEKLSEIGESDKQREIKEHPVFGMFTKPYMDWKYGRISGAEAVEGIAIDAAIEGTTTVAGGAVLKGVGKLARPVLSKLLSKSAANTRFARNLQGAYSTSTRQANCEAAMIGSVDKVKIGDGIYRSYNRDAIGSMNTALRQRTALAFEEAGILNARGELTAKAVKESEQISLVTKENPLGNIENEKIQKILLKDGSKIEDWRKYSTQRIGTPQGNAISPILANVYLHYVLDLWFEKRFKKRCRGEAFLIRYADDFVCVFQYQNEAEEFLKELEERMKKFKLGVPSHAKGV